MKSNPSLRFVIISLAVLTIGAGWVWISRALPGSTTAGQIPAPHPGFLAPNITLTDNQGQKNDLSELRGQPVVLNFWASWCRPCRAEMPALQRVYQDYRASGLEILAVNQSTQDDHQSAIALVDELGLSFPILFDLDGIAASQYQVRALPTTFFIDANGTIQDVVVGGPMSEALLRIRIEQLLDLPTEKVK